MCWIQWPKENISPVGIIPWKTARLSQQYGTRWSDIETSAGVYSSAALTALDSMITFQRQNGANVYFGVYGTPRFYADNTTPKPTVTDFNALGPWNGFGECANPTSLAALAAYVTLIVNRYNKTGGAWYDANFATLGKGIQFWEPWNEPDYPNANNSPAIGQKGTNFFWGTAPQMVDMCKTQWDAIKALDASIVVTSPGFSGQSSGKTFMTTTGGLGATGLSISEAFVWHPYARTPPGTVYNQWQDNIVTGPNGLNELRSWMLTNGTSLPLWINEWGVWDGNVNQTPSITAWYGEPPEFRYRWYMRFMMTIAAYGVQVFAPWHWQQTNPIGNSGNWQQDVNGVAKAYNDFNRLVVGKEIVLYLSGYKSDGTVFLNFSDNSTLTI
jgi:hypothetical protein